MFLERIKTTDLDPKKKYVFVIPMGSTEQHGPFLPLGTDSYIQNAIIEKAEKGVPQAIFLPTLRITCSEEHKGFLGSVWIGTDTLERMLHDICISIQPYARHIVLVSAHGGNIKTLDRFVEKNRNTFSGVRLTHLELDSKEILRKTEEMLGGSVDDHAGNSEISMMLVSNPSLVKKPSANYPKRVIKDAFSTNRVADFSPDGIVDNHPKWVVNKKLGKRCIEMAAEELKNALAKLL